MDLWPLAKIAGRVQMLEKGSKLPAKLSVTTLAPPSHLKRPEAPKGLLDCPVDEKGEWSCQLPAATFDLVISAAGFIPHYRWGVEVPPGKTLQLGTFDLKLGASVAGWVVVEDGPLDPARCVARLAPLAASGPRESTGLARTAVERKVQKDGFFQLTGIAPGSYLLEISQPGFAPAQVSPVKVWPRAESFMREPVHLQRPLRLDVSLSPPLDWLGKPWRLEVLRSSESPGQLARQVFGGSAGEDGQVSVAGQAPGTFHFTVLDSLGNRVHSERDVAIAGAADAQRTLKVDVVTVRGEVTLGREPLATTLWFGGRNGAESVKMESDATGRFHGILPQRKVWTVAVEGREPKLDTRARVEVEPDRAGRADVTIALPDTRVFGRVVDETGQPVASAEVLFLSAQAQMSVFTDERGNFEERGIPTGPLALIAQGAPATPGARRTSDRVEMVLSEDQALGPVELRLRRTRELAGKVFSPRGPVPGAEVDVLPTAPELDAGDSGVTDVDGAFHVNLSERTQSAVAIVSAPGSALQAFPVETGSEELTLRVGDEGGALEVALPYLGEELLGRGLSLSLSQNGLPIPGIIFLKWASRNGGTPPGTATRVFRIPNVAPGGYQICLVPVVAAPGASRVPEGCASGFLGSGEVLRLNLPRK
jgi:hypothetical protein